MAWRRHGPCFLVEEYRGQLLRSLEELRELKQEFEMQLGKISGLRVYPAVANFLLVELVDTSLDADAVYRRLGRSGLLIRVCDSFRGLAKGRFIRLAVRIRSENERLVAELSAVCAELSRRAA